MIGARGVWFVDVLDALGRFWQSLINIANSGPYGQLFVLLFLVGATGLIAQMTALVRAIRNRSRQSEDADEDVNNPNAELASAMSKISDALLIFANGFTPLLKSIQDTTQSTEAGVAGLVAETKRRQPIDTALLETDDVIVNALDRLQKTVSGVRTREEAEMQNQALRDGIRTDTASAVAPVLSQLTEHAAAVTVIGSQVAAVPDALVLKMKEHMPPIVREAFTQISAERDTFRAQNMTLTADLMARDQTIEAQRQDIARLTRERDDALTAAATLKAAQSPDVKPEPEKSAETDLVKPEAQP